MHAPHTTRTGSTNPVQCRGIAPPSGRGNESNLSCVIKPWRPFTARSPNRYPELDRLIESIHSSMTKPSDSPPLRLSCCGSDTTAKTL